MKARYPVSLGLDCAKSNRFYNLDFLRFLFALVIVNHHLSCKVFPVLAEKFSWLESVRWDASKGYMGVEFFFILSGVFLCACLERKEENIALFALKKIIRLWPLLFFSILCFWGASQFDLVKFEKYDDVLNLLFLQTTGLTQRFGNNDSAWFVSCLFWCCLFYFVFYQKNRKNFFWIVSFIVWFSFVAMIQQNKGSFNGHIKQAFPLFSFGMLRGLAEIGLGFFVWKAYLFLSEKIPSSLRIKILFGIIEVFLLFFVFRNVAFRPFKFQNDLLLTLMIACLILAFMLQKSFLSVLLNRKVFSLFGAISYAIYVMQEVCFIFFRKGLSLYRDSSGLSIQTVYFGCLVITVFVGACVYLCVEKPAFRFLKRTFLTGDEK